MSNQESIEWLKNRVKHLQESNNALKVENNILKTEKNVIQSQSLELMSQITDLKAKLIYESELSKSLQNTLEDYKIQLKEVQSIQKNVEEQQKGLAVFKNEIITAHESMKEDLTKHFHSQNQQNGLHLKEAIGSIRKHADDVIQMVREDVVDDFQNTVDEMVSIAKDELKEVKDVISKHEEVLSIMKLQNSLGDWYNKLLECESDIAKQGQLLFEALDRNISISSFSYFLDEVPLESLLWNNPDKENRNVVMESVLKANTMNKFKMLKNKIGDEKFDESNLKYIC